MNFQMCVTHIGVLHRGFFIFLFFIFVFYKNIFSILKFTEIYPAAPLPVGRDLAARQRGGRGISEKNFAEKIARKSLGPVAR